MIAIDECKHGVEHRSGPFDELVNYFYNLSVGVEMMRRVMTFTVLHANHTTTTRHLFTCYQRENYNPCNGFIFEFPHLYLSSLPFLQNHILQQFSTVI